MRSYSKDTFHVFKKELRNTERRLRDIGYLKNNGNKEMLSVEKGIVNWTAQALDSVENVCIRFYLYEIYVLKKTKLSDASAELGYQNPSAFIKMIKKSVYPVLSEKRMNDYFDFIEQEQQLLKEELSEIH